MTAAEILARTVAAYATLSTYADEGALIQRWDAPHVETAIAFDTAFARPRQFRFSWIARHPDPSLHHICWRSAIGSNDDGAWAWLLRDEAGSRCEAMSLTMAVASATGISGGAALTIGRFLFPEIDGFALGDLRSPTLAGVEDCEGIRCYRIAGTDPEFGPHDAWIGSADFLLRKLCTQAGDCRQTEIRRNVRCDRALPADAFAVAA